MICTERPRFGGAGKEGDVKNDFEIVKAAVYNSIGVGRANATTREELTARTGYKDRLVREAIEDLRHDRVILSIGRGYYIPETTPQGRQEAAIWVRMQNSRMMSIKAATMAAQRFAGMGNKQIAGQMEMFGGGT